MTLVHGSDLPFSHIPGAIRNPDNPQHLMVVKPVPRRVQVFDGETLLADTTDAVHVLELGKTLYDPVLYVPEGDIRVPLDQVDKTTHCPLKGDASYHARDEETVCQRPERPARRQRRVCRAASASPGRVKIHSHKE
ncbi:MAG: DUF427 domain-containing protein [bacterium]|nr:DUF427 domain-containing protein [bacterium]